MKLETLLNKEHKLTQEIDRLESKLEIAEICEEPTIRIENSITTKEAQRGSLNEELDCSILNGDYSKSDFLKVCNDSKYGGYFMDCFGECFDA